MMSTSFNEICKRLVCKVDDEHRSISAESPEGTRIVFAVPAEKVDWTAGTCVLLALPVQQPQENRPVSPAILRCEYRAERCATNPAIEALGVVQRGSPTAADAPGPPTADNDLVLRLRVERQAPGHYVARILEVLFIADGNPRDTP
jgi:hypothetical protein